MFKSKISLPEKERVKGEVHFSCTHGEKNYSYIEDIDLIPKPFVEYDNFEEEYENTLRIINTYMPEELRAEKITELRANNHKFGTNDYKIFRRKVWKIAKESIFEKRDSYLNDANWYNAAIATAQTYKFIGDIAFNLAILPFGGHLTAFVLDNVKGTVIDMADIYYSSDSIGFNEFLELIKKRMIDLAGQADVLTNIPEKG